MRAIYSIGIRFLFVAMWLAQFFNKKAKKWIVGQREIMHTLPKVDLKRNVYWFHCASLGEFDQGLPIMWEIKNREESALILVSFFSPSGIDFVHKRNHPAEIITYLPLDTKRKAEKFVKHIHPKMVFFVKYEFWYNHLKASRRFGAKIYGVSSLFRPKHRFFTWYGGFFRKALRLFDHFFTQDSQSVDLLKSIGIPNAIRTGDTRYDRMQAVVNAGEKNELIAQFKGKEELIIFGSAWKIDIATFQNQVFTLSKKYKIIIAPHLIDEAHLIEIEQLLNDPSIRFTKLQQRSFDETTEIAQRILILDTIGQLTSAYHYAKIAYIGGGFTGKLHNILEPGAFGVPVIFGPKHERFPEAKSFKDLKIGFEANNEEEFEAIVKIILRTRKDIQYRLLELFNENAGASRKIVDSVFCETAFDFNM